MSIRTSLGVGVAKHIPRGGHRCRPRGGRRCRPHRAISASFIMRVASSNYELSIRLSGPQPLLPPSPPSGSSSARRLSFGRSCLSEGVNGTMPLPENEQHTPSVTSRCPNILVVAYVSSFLSYGVMLNEYGDATSVCSPSLYGMGVLSIHV